MENNQLIFSGSTANEDLIILTIKLVRGGTVFQWGQVKMDHQTLKFWRIVFLVARMTRLVRSLAVVVFGIITYWYFWNRNAVVI